MIGGAVTARNIHGECDLTVAVECPYCGADMEDPFEGFLAHMKASEPCRVQYEHQAASTAEEWGTR